MSLSAIAQNRTNPYLDPNTQSTAHQDEIEIIRARLIKSENSGFITQTTEEIRAEFKEELRRNGEL